VGQKTPLQFLLIKRLQMYKLYKGKKNKKERKKEENEREKDRVDYFYSWAVCYYFLLMQI
jgi:hypothetical protein